MVQPVGGSPSIPPSQQGTSGVPAQEQEYIQFLEAFIELAEHKGEMSAAQATQLINSLNQINTSDPKSIYQLNDLISGINQSLPSNQQIPSFAQNGVADFYGLFHSYVNAYVIGIDPAIARRIEADAQQLQPGEGQSDYNNMYALVIGILDLNKLHHLHIPGGNFNPANWPQ